MIINGILNVPVRVADYLPVIMITCVIKICVFFQFNLTSVEYKLLRVWIEDT